jgi:two-component system OmpR family sensor kinase
MRGQGGYVLVVAVPLSEVDATLGHVLWIEIALGAGVLALLVLAAWLLVRRELRPLDDMAAAAGEIAGGDLTRRVEPAEPHTEVGRLGLALNAMLAQIEGAFAARAASEQRLRRFLADASHELRTPLTSIRGYAELFHRGADKRPQDLAVSMRRIEEEAQRMGVLVDDLLLLARLDDQRPLAREPLDMAALVADGIRDARAGAPGRTITLSVASAPAVSNPSGNATGSPVSGGDAGLRTAGEADLRTDGGSGSLWIVGDEHRLRQVVANLLSNATRHTPAGSPVEVELGVEESWVVLRVRDHGPGLSPEQAVRVFEPFYRSDAGRSREAGGAGLGLTIVKAIVDAHGGEVVVAGTPGGGATLSVRLPLESGVPTAVATGSQTDAGVAAAG